MEYEPFDQLEAPPKPPRPGMPIGKVVLINFAIMLTYMILTGLSMGSDYQAGMSVLATEAVLILIQTGINLFLGFVLVFTENHKSLGGALLIGGIITGVLGFGSCLAHVSLLEA